MNNRQRKYFGDVCEIYASNEYLVTSIYIFRSDLANVLCVSMRFQSVLYDMYIKSSSEYSNISVSYCTYMYGNRKRVFLDDTDTAFGPRLIVVCACMCACVV